MKTRAERRAYLTNELRNARRASAGHRTPAPTGGMTAWLNADDAPAVACARGSVLAPLPAAGGAAPPPNRRIACDIHRFSTQSTFALARQAPDQQSCNESDAYDGQWVCTDLIAR